MNDSSVKDDMKNRNEDFMLKFEAEQRLPSVDDHAH
jgi:hypothetical protein